MKLTKSKTNNCIVCTLDDVRKHPNADRLQIATVLGTQVIVGLDARTGDVMLYFDSNLRLGHDYLYYNNLYSSQAMNVDPTVKGYFPKSGRVKCQKLRGEMSNGFVAELKTLRNIPEIDKVFPSDLKYLDYLYPSLGTEFTHINDVLICEKYIPVGTCVPGKPRESLKTHMFHKHWDTKQLMRCVDELVPGPMWIEEKLHGTSGRTARALIETGRPWWQFWKPAKEYRIVSGTRRIDNIDYHIPSIRKVIHAKVAPLLHKGEEIYYEIYGGNIQPEFNYGICEGHFKCMLYRVTHTNEDGYCIDMDRLHVYRRAVELGLEAPTVLSSGMIYQIDIDCMDKLTANIRKLAEGPSMLDGDTLREGIVCWFQRANGHWTCLKYKTEEFLSLDSRNKDKGIEDCEDVL